MTDAAFVDLVQVGPGGVSLQWRRADAGSRAGSAYRGQEKFPCWLKLVRRHHSIPVEIVQDQTIQPGRRVEVVGYLRHEDSGAIIEDAYVYPIANDDRPAAEPVPRRPLLDVATLTAMDEANRPDSLRLQGIVTGVRKLGRRHLVAIEDRTGGIWIPRTVGQDELGPAPGDFVEVYCDPSANGPERAIVAKKIITLGRGLMPTPLPHPMEHLLPRKGEGRWIEIEGVVYAIGPGDVGVLRSSSGYFSAEVSGLTREDWAGLIDTKIRLRGDVLYPQPGQLRILTPSRDNLEVIEWPPGMAAHDEPPLIAELARRSMERESHRVRVLGVVTYTDGQLLVIEDESGASSVRTLQAVGATVGDRVEVVGFPDMNAGGTLDLSEAALPGSATRRSRHERGSKRIRPRCPCLVSC